MCKRLWGIWCAIYLFICLNMNAQLCICSDGVCLTPSNCVCCTGGPPQESPQDKAKSLKDQASGFIKDGSCNDKCKEEFDSMKAAKECVEKTEQCKADTEDYEKKQKDCDAAKEKTKSACTTPSSPDSPECASAQQDEQQTCNAATEAKDKANKSCGDAKNACPGINGLDGNDGKPPTSENVGKAYNEAVDNLSSKLGAYKGCCFAATGKGAFCGIVPPKHSNHSDNDIIFLTAILFPCLALFLLKFLQYIKIKQRI